MQEWEHKKQINSMHDRLLINYSQHTMYGMKCEYR